MFGKKKVVPVQTQKQKTVPAFLREDYPFKATEEPITDLSVIEDGAVYEIKCNKCETSIRSRGQNIKVTYARLKVSGCLGCGDKGIVICKVNMSKAVQNEDE